MPAAVELLAERADELALGVEHQNGVHLLADALVRDVDEAFGIEGDVVRRLPGVVGGEFAPVVLALVHVPFDADGGFLRPAFVFGTQDDRADGGDRRGFEEFAALHGESSGGERNLPEFYAILAVIALGIPTSGHSAVNPPTYREMNSSMRNDLCVA